MQKLKRYAKVYLAILGTYLILDAIWLGIVAKTDYQMAIGYLMRDIVPIWPWVTFYLVYCACILKLCVYASNKPTIFTAVLHGAILGLASYGAYNLTNYAIINEWPLGIVFKDWTWGVFVTTASATAGIIAHKVWAPKSSATMATMKS